MKEKNIPFNCRPNRRLPFIKIKSEHCLDSNGFQRRLDALFIPTFRISEGLLLNLSKLSVTAERVFILPSGPGIEAMLTGKKLPKNVVLLKDFLTKSNINWFMSLRSSKNPTLNISLDYDLPLKRNLALHLSRLCGYQSVGFLDDDITITNSQIFAAASIIGKQYPIIGFHVFEYPDVSTTEHIFRNVVGEISETIPGGNCLFFNPNRV